MTTTTRDAELNKAREESAKAKEAWLAAKSHKARRDTAEVLEFWSNKVAFLASEVAAEEEYADELDTECRRNSYLI